MRSGFPEVLSIRHHILPPPNWKKHLKECPVIFAYGGTPSFAIFYIFYIFFAPFMVSSIYYYYHQPVSQL